MILPALDSRMKEIDYLSHPVRQGLLILMNLILMHSFVLFSPKIFINYLLHIVHVASHGRESEK